MSTTLYIRTMDEAAVTQIKRAAAARQMTLAVYIANLSALHERARASADRGNQGVQALLVALGLETKQN